MLNRRATAPVPPRRLMMRVGSIASSLGPPKDLSIGAPKRKVVRLAYMEKWAGRIRERMTERGVSDSELTKAIKASQPSVFQWFNAPKGKNTTSMIRGDNLISVSRCLDLSPEWILTGKGPKELSQYVGISVAKLQIAIVSVRKALRTFGLETDEVRAASLISYAYRQLRDHPETMSKEQMQDFDALIRHELRGDLPNEENAKGTAERPPAGRSASRAENAPAGKAKAGGRKR